ATAAPPSRSISASVSTKRRPRRRARAGPTVDLPAPIMPTSQTGPLATMRPMIEEAGGPRAPRRHTAQGDARASARGGLLRDHPRRHEDQELLAVVLDRAAAEQRPHERDVGEEGHRGALLVLVHDVDAADHERLAVLHQRLGVDL